MADLFRASADGRRACWAAVAWRHACRWRTWSLQWLQKLSIKYRKPQIAAERHRFTQKPWQEWPGHRRVMFRLKRRTKAATNCSKNWGNWSWAERHSMCCTNHLEIDLHCGTYSTADALLPVVVVAALEGWHRPCAHCGGIHLVQSVGFPLAVHCPSGFKEKHTFVLHILSALHLSP